MFVEKGYESQLVPEGASMADRLSRTMKDLARGVLGLLGVKRYAAGMGRRSAAACITLETLVNAIQQKVDLVSMDVQGFEAEILQGSLAVLERGDVTTFLIGTHSDLLHRQCRDMLSQHGYQIEYEEANTQHQPDGSAARRVTASAQARGSCWCPRRAWRHRL